MIWMVQTGFMSEKQTTFNFWRGVGSLFALSMGLAALEIGRNMTNLGVDFSVGVSWWWVVFTLGALSILTLIYAWTPLFPRHATVFSSYHDSAWLKHKFLNWTGVTGLGLIFSLWVLTRGHLVLNGFYARLLIYLLVCGLGAMFLRAIVPGRNWKIALAGSMLITAAIFKGLIYILPTASASPFSLSWSEGSRYYYGSLFLSEWIYGMDVPPSTWHATRYLLMSIPFIIRGLPIWVHRLWQAFLWVGLSGWGGYLLAKRVKIGNPSLVILTAAWSFLVFNLGPVYYHLMVCVILILWGVDFNKLTKTMVVVILSSLWAGLSRINWVPVPVFLAVTLYFLERPWNKEEDGWRYLSQPMLYCIGGLTGFASYLAYLRLSGNETSKFGSSFTSDLLWNRLWPNPTYWVGILLGVVIISVPMWLIIYCRLRENRQGRSNLKWVGYGLMMATLLAGGLVVSVKIGGGSNLHNMDAYFVLLMVPACIMFWKKDVFDLDHVSTKPGKFIPYWISVLVIVIPCTLTIREGWVISQTELNQDKTDLAILEQGVSEAIQNGGEVLFIAERQMQVFQMVKDTTLVPEYEKVELMEMAMAGNDDYLDKFYDDIADHRFSLIVLDAIRFDMKDESEAFSEEHNIWVEKVIKPVVKHYEFAPLGMRRNVNLLTPKESVSR